MATKTPLAEYAGTFRVMASGDTIPAAIVPTLNQNTTGSAATLTTARTINGTSFNGSANITTANWGTARTITIGSTGKSVNGSANVTWSLAEIGAAATNADVYFRDVTAARDTVTGAVWLGSDGFGYLYRDTTNTLAFRAGSNYFTLASPGHLVACADASVNKMIKLTAAAYAALGTKDASTLYVIVG